MPTSLEIVKIPLELYQVLEEEYASLHEPIPEDENFFIELPDPKEPGKWRRIKPARDWLFYEGHLKDPGSFARSLLPHAQPPQGQTTPPPAGPPVPAPGVDQEKLKDYLRSKLSPALIKSLDDWAQGNAPLPADLERQINEELNKNVLTDKSLYHPDRFKDVQLDASKGIVNLWSSPDPFQDDNVTHFNRLLLEDAFPEAIERLHIIRLTAIHHHFHTQKQTALCLSGGGIRSGTFALGLLQGLARHNLLEKFDYLSTVSGGGYIGGWLTAWLHRHPKGLEGVTEDLANCPPRTKIDPDAPPINYLRQYSNFITPKVGLLTADTWTFIGIYLRNLFINSLVFIPLLVAVLLLPRLLLALTLMPSFFGQPGLHYRHIFQLAGFVFGVWALAYIIFNRPGMREQLKEHRPFFRDRADQGHLLRWCLLPLLVAAFCLTTYSAWSGESEIGEGIGAFVVFGAWFREIARLLLRQDALYAFMVFGALFSLVGWAIALGILKKYSELAWLVLAVAVGGVVSWRLPRYIIVNPVIWVLFTLAGWIALVVWKKYLKLRWLVLAVIVGGVVSWLFSRYIIVNPIVWVLFTLAAWVIALVVLTKYLELAWLVLAGVVGGVVSWFLSRYIIVNPVVGYQNNEEAGAAFPWTALTTPLLKWRTEWYVCIGVPLFLLIFLIGASFFVGWSSRSQRVNDEDREWWARLGAWVIISIIAWVVSCALVIFGPIALLSFPTILAPLGGVSGLIALIIGRSAKSPATSKDEVQRSRAAALMGRLLPLLALIFLAVLVAAVSLGTTGVIRGLAISADPPPPSEVVAPANRTFTVEWWLSLLTNVPEEPPRRGFNQYVKYIRPVVTPAPQGTNAAPLAVPVRRPSDGVDASAEKKADESLEALKIVHLNVLHHTSFWFITILLLFLSGVGMGLARMINLNIFSLHGGYRNRLIRGFLAASRPKGERKPNPFTGFDPKDNLHMHELRPTLLDEGDLLNPGLIAGKLKSALEQEQTDPLSAYLVKNNLLESIKDALQAYEPDAAVPAQLLANLRATLNSVLEKEDTLRRETSLQCYVQTDRAIRAQRAIDAGARSEYHILLNRLIMEQAYPNALKPCAYPPPPYKLLHVINTALNLVGGDNLAWQQRKAEPFSITPLHSGCYRLGYRRSRDYGGKVTNGISIGTAAAISGAAASSNMGYYTTSPIISLLLTLFNVRLGWWLGNPGHAGTFTYHLSCPKYSVGPIVDEAFGLTDDQNKYVYLTDGGHFENLAVYEMVLRRCHIIVASDGAQDEEYRFGDLGNAVRKIRIDLGVPIEFSSVPIYAGPEPQDKKGSGFYWAIGKIRYSCIDRNAKDGILLYIKPAVYGGEPRDVLEYKKNFPAFPHQSTSDQFFDEPQFESYRVLGSYIMDRLCGEGTTSLDLCQVVERAFQQLKDGKAIPDPEFIKWLEDWLRPLIAESLTGPALQSHSL